MTNNSLSPQACVCGSGLDYNNCCGPFHANTAAAPTAEALMRSRYSAYVLRNSAYLEQTWDAGKRPAKIDFSKETAIWQGLSVLSSKKGGSGDSKGVVEFKAFYQQDGEEC
ncbi:MAG: zinc chelation protein SecC, partial [Methylococcaceae bacterium]|nr:zinc chelation protein SecC [Methylococcaceae bacterium]